MGVQPKAQVVPKFMTKSLGIFIPLKRELLEIMYQYDRDYELDISKFEETFKFVPNPYDMGIIEIIKRDC